MWASWLLPIRHSQTGQMSNRTLVKELSSRNVSVCFYFVTLASIQWRSPDSSVQLYFKQCFVPTVFFFFFLLLISCFILKFLSPCVFLSLFCFTWSSLTFSSSVLFHLQCLFSSVCPSSASAVCQPSVFTVHERLNCWVWTRTPSEPPATVAQ